ncbi:MAG: hypothetical protein HFH68_14150 [Lachnospiraceae bacterium]|nr:hypothetical protein [Lachnospiraceae bacterium]
MDDEKLKLILNNYCQETAKTCEKEENAKPGHIFSKDFENKMNRLIKKENYYARHTKTAPFIKTASIILFVIISLITAGYVSAAITGFNPWNFIININKDEGYIKIKKNIRNKETTASKFKKRKYKLPQDIPEGFEIETNSSTNGDIMVIWSNGNAKFDLISWKVENEENVYKNSEFDKTENINIVGYAGTYSEKMV